MYCKISSKLVTTAVMMMKIFLVDGWVGHLTPRLVQTCSTNGTIVVLPPFPSIRRKNFQQEFQYVCCVLLLVVI